VEIWTLNTGKVGTPTDNLRTFTTSNQRVYNGVDLQVMARIRNSGFVLAGLTADKLQTTSCDVRDNPNSLRFCDPTTPFRTLFKASGSYMLPWEFQVSASYNARPGDSIAANYTVTSAIAGRTIIGSTAGTQQISVNLIEPNTMFRDYIHQLDTRFARNFRFGRYRVQGMVDVYNILNLGTVTTLNQTFGASWLNPQAIQTSRYVRFGGQVSF
jgi:hypothetical protein